MRRLASAFLLLLGGILLFTALSPVGARAQNCEGPELTTDATSVRAGDSITITGTGFDPDCASGAGPHSPDVELTLVQGDETVELTTARASDADPSFEADVDIPSDLDPGSATVTAQGAAGNATLAVQLTVGTQVTPGDDTTDGTTDGETAGDLAETGLDGTALVGLAFALLLFGTALEWVAQVLPSRL
jgi:hypothetical protein